MIEKRKIWSNTLNSETILKIITPVHTTVNKIIILLHGRLSPEMSILELDIFINKLELEKLCEDFGVIIVIPLMKNRYYISSEEYDCKNFISKELPEIIKEKYINIELSDFILAGISMGGYGATLIGALTTSFNKIISISGSYIAHDIAEGNHDVWGNLNPESIELKDTFLGSFMPLDSMESDPNKNALASLKLLKSLKKGIPFIVATCGTKEWLYPRNVNFTNTMDKYNIHYKFYPIEEGKHEWKCFNEGLKKALTYFEKLDKNSDC